MGAQQPWVAQPSPPCGGDTQAWLLGRRSESLMLFTDHHAQKPHRPGPEAVSSPVVLTPRWAQGPSRPAAVAST